MDKMITAPLQKGESKVLIARCYSHNLSQQRHTRACKMHLELLRMLIGRAGSCLSDPALAFGLIGSKPAVRRVRFAHLAGFSSPALPKR